MNKKPPMDFLKLVLRSPDQGDGWRNVSDMLWPTTQEIAAEFPTLLELAHKQVRLTAEAKTLVAWA